MDGVLTIFKQIEREFKRTEEMGRKLLGRAENVECVREGARGDGADREKERKH